MTKKKFINPLFIALPIIVLLTILVMFGTFLLVEQDTHQVKKKYLNTANHDELWKIDDELDEETGLYYQLFVTSDRGRFLAFKMTKADLDTIEKCTGSYYPESYWQGECWIMDLTDMFEENIAQGRINEEELRQVQVYDISAYKGYEGYLGNGGGLLLFFLWVGEAGLGIVLFLVILIIGIIVQVSHNHKIRIHEGDAV